MIMIMILTVFNFGFQTYQALQYLSAEKTNLPES